MTLKEELEFIQAEKKKLEEREKEIYQASLQAPDNEKVCEDFLAEMITRDRPYRTFGYPIDIHGIEVEQDPDFFHNKGWRKQKPSLCRIRPCAEEYGNKTYLGVYLGDIARGVHVTRNRDSGVLCIKSGWHNPAIWVPELERVIFGAESWWGPIKSEDDIREVTDESIQDQWYVKLMKRMVEEGSKSED